MDVKQIIEVGGLNEPLLIYEKQLLRTKKEQFALDWINSPVYLSGFLLSSAIQKRIG